MQKHTYREYKAWHRWLGEQLNNPSLTDMYLMQIAMRVHQSFVKNPQEISRENERIKFTYKPKDPPKPVASKEVQMSTMKAIWFGLTGYKGKE